MEEKDIYSPMVDAPPLMVDDLMHTPSSQTPVLNCRLHDVRCGMCEARLSSAQLYTSQYQYDVKSYLHEAFQVWVVSVGFVWAYLRKYIFLAISARIRIVVIKS